MAATLPAQPHVVMLPMPLIGHLNPMMQLAQHLASVNLLVTFVYYRRPASSLIRRKIQDHIAQFRDSQHLRIEVVPDGLSEEETKDSMNFAILPETLSVMEQELGFLIEKLNRSAHPVTCIVCDTIYGLWPQDLAERFGIPRADFSPSSATNYILYWHLPLLISRGYVDHRIGNTEKPSTAKNTDEEAIIDCLPGVPTLRVKDLPSFFLEGPEADCFLDHTTRSYHRGKEARWVLIHTCYELESSVIDALRAARFPIHSIGPMLPSEVDNNLGKSSAMPSLPLKDDESLHWLDTQNISSVLYVSFGSSGTWSPDEIRALTLGVEDSGQPFLWVVRPDMVADSNTFTELLPEGFTARTKHRSLMVTWAPQVAVLAHPSVGGFLTHSGWNSTLESIFMGVPMAGVADLADQTTNLRLITHEWKIGVGIERKREGGGVQREDVERAVREVMDEEGDVRRRARQMRKVVRKAILEEDGSSRRNLHAFIQDLRDLSAEKQSL